MMTRRTIFLLAEDVVVGGCDVGKIGFVGDV